MGRKRILVIDGDFFANRAIFSLEKIMRNQNQELTLSTIPEMKSFRNEMESQLGNLIKTFHNDQRSLIDGVIFVADNHSWRKDVTPYIPYYMKDNAEYALTPMCYKENRVEKKEESPINWDNYYLVYNEFTEDISQIIPTIKVKGLEGDDIINLLSERYENNGDVEFMVFCNDGDLKQCVKDNFFLFRNIQSKEAPHGAFCISKGMYSKIYEKSAMSTLMGDSRETAEYTKLFSIQISTPYSIERSLGRGIELATPNIIALTKSICGDKKDNIFPIIRWKASTGTRNYNVTEKYIDKVLTKLGLELNDENALRCMTERDLIIQLLINLRSETGQFNNIPNEKFKSVGEHFLHNLKLNRLKSSYIPKEYVEEFDEVLEQIKPMLLMDNEAFDNISLMSNRAQADAAGDLLKNSIPIGDSNTGDILAAMNKKSWE